MKVLLDLLPLVAFFIVAKTHGIIEAAAALLIATVIVATIQLSTQKGKLEKQQWITLLLTIVFCGLTILLKDDLFIKWKSSVINSVFAVALIVSVLIGKPLLKIAMHSVFTLTKSGWNKLTLVWAVYFVMMAGLQYFFAFRMSEEAWINFKAYGWIPFMLVFLIGQFVVLKNNINPELTADSNEKNSDVS